MLAWRKMDSGPDAPEPFHSFAYRFHRSPFQHQSEREQSGPAMTLRAMDVGSARFNAIQYVMQGIRMRCRTVKNRKAQVAGVAADLRWLREFRGQINVIGECSIDLSGEQPSPNEQSFRDVIVGRFGTDYSNQMPNHARI
jgi:hypothetical protein